MKPQTKALIPPGLTAGERKIYEILLQVVAQREMNNKAAPRVVLITDIKEDLDDLLTVIELIPLDTIGLIK